MAAVLLLWPSGMPTQTLRFWLTLLVFPSGLAAVIVMQRYSHFEAQVLDARIHNEVCREYTEELFDFARRPLVLIGAAFRFSEASEINDLAPGAVQDRSLSLPALLPATSQGQLIKAPQLTLSDPELHFAAEQALLAEAVEGISMDQLIRQHASLAWLFAQLQDSLAEEISQLPAGLPLVIQLRISSALRASVIQALWQKNWMLRSMRQARLELPMDDADSSLMEMDNWLDQVHDKAQQCARLMVAVHLHAAVNDLPPSGSAEAGVALLLLPELVAERFDVTGIANLHRPVRGDADQHDAALEHALEFAGIDAGAIGAIWQTGVAPESSGKFLLAASQMGLTMLSGDLDDAIGNTGIATPWLAIACAIHMPSVAAHLILAGHVNQDTRPTQADHAVLLFPSAPPSTVDEGSS